MSDPFIAQVTIFAGNFAPRAWAFCDGQLLSIAQNSALFSLLGTTYGGDGRTTFGLPDLRGRVAIGPRNGPGLSSYRLGQKGGVEDVTLNQTQIPSHSHAATTDVTDNLSFSPPTSPTPEGDDPTGQASSTANEDIYGAAGNGSMSPCAKTGGVSATTTILPTGGSRSHENMQPYLAINYIIALFGVFPSRS